MLSHILLALLLLSAPALASVTCQDAGNGLQSCTDGPDPAPLSGGLSVTFSGSPGIVLMDDLTYSGFGVMETQLEGISIPTERAQMDSLLFPLWGQLLTARQAAYFLAMHGYNVTANGQVTLSDGSRWQVICTEKTIRTEAM